MSYTPQASGVIHAECASKANARRYVRNRRTGKSMSIKSARALLFERARMEWGPVMGTPITGPLQVTVRCYYASRRPDLDPALVLDKLQRHGVIENDRQVFDLHATKLIDPDRPRVEWSVRSIPEPVAIRQVA